MERSLQQARLERQAKTTEDDIDTGSEQQSVSTTGTTPSPKQGKKESDDRISASSQVKSPPPLETDLDEQPLSQSLDDPTVTSDKARLLDNEIKETKGNEKKVVEEPGSPTSNEESTLLDNN